MYDKNLLKKHINFIIIIFSFPFQVSTIINLSSVIWKYYWQHILYGNCIVHNLFTICVIWFTSDKVRTWPPFTFNTNVIFEVLAFIIFTWYILQNIFKSMSKCLQYNKRPYKLCRFSSTFWFIHELVVEAGCRRTLYLWNNTYSSTTEYETHVQIFLRIARQSIQSKMQLNTDIPRLFVIIHSNTQLRRYITYNISDEAVTFGYKTFNLKPAPPSPIYQSTSM